MIKEKEEKIKTQKKKFSHINKKNINKIYKNHEII